MLVINLEETEEDFNEILYISPPLVTTEPQVRYEDVCPFSDDLGW